MDKIDLVSTTYKAAANVGEMDALPIEVCKLHFFVRTIDASLPMR